MLLYYVIIACFLFSISVIRSKSGTKKTTGNTPTPCKPCKVVFRAPSYVLKHYKAIFTRFNPLWYKYTLVTEKLKITAFRHVKTPLNTLVTFPARIKKAPGNRHDFRKTAENLRKNTAKIVIFP